MCIVIGLSMFIPYPTTLFFLLNSSIIFVCVFILSSAFSSIPNNCSTVYSLLILGEFLTALALCPNLREVMVSASLKDEGEILTINEVKEFPPRLSCSNLVSFESLQGMWPPLLQDNECITFPKADRLVLILMASFSDLPQLPVLDSFSLPARSMTVSLPLLAQPVEKSFDIRVTMKSIWDREETEFI